MKRITRSRPPAAIVVATMALIAALAGTALAGPDATSSAITKAKVKKVANKQINKRLPWQTADIADAAVTGPKLADGAVSSAKIEDGAVTTADLAVGASPRVYMHFDNTGTFQPGESRGVVSISKPAGNVACLDLDITPVIGGGTRGINAGAAPFHIQVGVPPEPAQAGCNADHQDAVVQVAGAATLPDVYAWFD